MFYESPLELLEQTKKEIEKDIEWYEKPNGSGVRHTPAYRQARIEALKSKLAEYEHAISILKRSEKLLGQ